MISYKEFIRSKKISEILNKDIDNPLYKYLVEVAEKGEYSEPSGDVINNCVINNYKYGCINDIIFHHTYLVKQKAVNGYNLSHDFSCKFDNFYKKTYGLHNMHKNVYTYSYIKTVFIKKYINEYIGLDKFKE